MTFFHKKQPDIAVGSRSAGNLSEMILKAMDVLINPTKLLTLECGW